MLVYWGQGTRVVMFLVVLNQQADVFCSSLIFNIWMVLAGIIIENNNISHNLYASET